MRSLFVVGFLLVFSTWGGHAVHAQPAAGAAPHIEWEVKNRFRLFRNEADFQRHVAAMRSDGVLAAERRLASEIVVRDALIAGMGDSIAAGEGNPDRAVRLSDQGFCFKRFGGGEYYRPGRAGFSVNKSCATMANEDTRAADWALQSARWLSGPCHRSLYSYQMRTALALAIENPHLAVTFLPLGCSGATINAGFLNNQRARECPSPGTGAACSGTVRAQIAALTELLAAARRQQADRSLDLVLLTIGANDIFFSWLIANVMIEAGSERSLLYRGGIIASVEDAQGVLDRELPGNFAKARAALKPLGGGNLSRVVYVSYGNPSLAGPNPPCLGGRDGFDVHPAFAVDGERLRQAVNFVSQKFLPGIRALARCEEGCRDPSSERMTFVEAHQTAFAAHGACARSDDDPAFDRECFSGKGETFESSLTKGATDPMTCGYAASEFRPYASRARWIRTANDSYFTAMTYPEGLPAVLQPSDLHDAIWGIFAAVYGGAVHPTAEGHAAMADAALPAAREVLGLPPPTAPVHSEPLPALAAPPNVLAPQLPTLGR